MEEHVIQRIVLINKVPAHFRVYPPVTGLNLKKIILQISIKGFLLTVM
jgi:hypothetical protein